MTLPVNLQQILISATKDQILAKMLRTASLLGLSASTWQPGDPTLSLFQSIASRFAEWESITEGDIPNIISGGFLGLAQGDWLTALCNYNYNTQKILAQQATCTVTLTNTTPKNFGTIQPYAIAVVNPHTSSAPTYRNTSAFTLGPSGGGSATATFTVAADVPGSGGAASVGQIDTISAPSMPGVTCTNPTAAIGVDAETDANLTARAQAKLGSLSPNGPRDAYRYVITTPSMQWDGSNATNVTRVRVVEDSTNGKALIYIAGDSGALASGDQLKALNTVQKWANPFCVSPIVTLAANNVIPVTYSLWVYDRINLTVAQVQTLVQTYLTTAFRQRPIGGDSITPGDISGFMFQDWIRAQIIEAVAPFAFKCSVSLPAGDVSLNLSNNWQAPAADVPVLGTVTPTVNFIASTK